MDIYVNVLRTTFSLLAITFVSWHMQVNQMKGVTKWSLLNRNDPKYCIQNTHIH